MICLCGPAARGRTWAVDIAKLVATERRKTAMLEGRNGSLMWSRSVSDARQSHDDLGAPGASSATPLTPGIAIPYNEASTAASTVHARLVTHNQRVATLT